MKRVLGFAVCAALMAGGLDVHGISFQPTGWEETADVDKSSGKGSASAKDSEAGKGDRSSGVDDEDSAAGLVASGTIVTTGRPWAGTWNVVIESVADKDSGAGYASGTGYTMLSFTVGKKAAVTVSGTLPSGQKVSVKTRLYAGSDEETAWIPVIVDSKKVGSFSFVIQITTDGELEVGAATEWDASRLKKPFVAEMENVTGGLGGYSDDAEGERMFNCSLEVDELPNGYELLEEVTPDGVEVVCTKKKWAAEKAGKVKFNKKTAEVTASDVNPAALKLKYAPKKGIFSGSFVLYGIIETRKGTYKLKKYKASVKGIVVGGCGYGTATVKGVGVFPCSVE